MNSNYIQLNIYISIDSEEIIVHEELNMKIIPTSISCSFVHKQYTKCLSTKKSKKTTSHTQNACQQKRNSKKRKIYIYWNSSLKQVFIHQGHGVKMPQIPGFLSINTESQMK